MNLEHINSTIDYTLLRNELVNDAEAISRQISANIIMILGGKYFPEIKWDTRRNHKLLYNICNKVINQGYRFNFNNENEGVREFYSTFNVRVRRMVANNSGKGAAFINAFHRRYIETRQWIEKEKETWNETEEGMSVEVLDKFWWDYFGFLTCVQNAIVEKAIEPIMWELKEIENYDKQK